MQDNFCKEALRLGAIRGFRFFRSYLRGREELLVHVKNRSTSAGVVPTVSAPPNRGTSSIHSSTSSTDGSFPGTAGNPLMQPPQSPVRSPVAEFDRSAHLAPASPSAKESEAASTSGDETAFLVGGYARYKVPYVWLRSNHGRFKVDGGDRDLPLKLRTTDDYKHNPCKVWDIVAELVQLNVSPSPANPFQVDFDAIDALPVEERALNYGAVASLLLEIQTTNPQLAPLVQADLAACLERHFATMPAFIAAGGGFASAASQQKTPRPQQPQQPVQQQQHQFVQLEHPQQNLSQQQLQGQRKPGHARSLSNATDGGGPPQQARSLDSDIKELPPPPPMGY